MDRDEISQLYRRLGPLIYRRCLRLLRDPDNARDATQEVFVRALKHKETLKADRECLPWLYRVATNYCLNFIRDRFTTGLISIPVSTAPCIDAPTAHPTTPSNQ